MMNPKMVKFSAILSTFLLVILTTTPFSSASEPIPSPRPDQTRSHKLASATPPDYPDQTRSHKLHSATPPDYPDQIRSRKLASAATPPDNQDQIRSHKLVSETDPDDQTDQIRIHKVAARDAITLSIREVQEMRKFVNDIPRLKSVVQSGQATQLLPCVERLIFDLSYMKSTLYRLRHLKPVHLTSDVDSLREMMGHSYEWMNVCNDSLKNVDEIVLSMLVRKLDDLSMIVGDVVYHVAIIEQDVNKRA